MMAYTTIIDPLTDVSLSIFIYHLTFTIILFIIDPHSFISIAISIIKYTSSFSPSLPNLPFILWSIRINVYSTTIWKIISKFSFISNFISWIPIYPNSILLIVFPFSKIVVRHQKVIVLFLLVTYASSHSVIMITKILSINIWIQNTKVPNLGIKLYINYICKFLYHLEIYWKLSDPQKFHHISLIWEFILYYILPRSTQVKPLLHIINLIEYFLV